MTSSINFYAQFDDDSLPHILPKLIYGTVNAKIFVKNIREMKSPTLFIKVQKHLLTSSMMQ